MKNLKNPGRRKSLLALIVSVSVFLQLLVSFSPPDMQASAVTAGEFAEAVTISRVALYSGTRELVNGDSVRSTEGSVPGDALILRQFFTITAQQAQEIHENPEKTYSIPIPYGLRWSAAYTTTLRVNRTVPFATLTVPGAGGTATITFGGEFWESYIIGDFIDDGWLDINCELDGANLPDAHNFELDLSNADPLKLLHFNRRPAARFLNKTGEYVENQFVWTITYAPPGGTALNALTFVDRFDHTIHTLVDTPTFAGDVVIEDDPDEPDFTIITFTPTTLPTFDAPLIFSYKTRLTDESLGAPAGSPTSGVITAKNSVTVSENDPVTWSGPVSAEVKVSEEARQWTTKSGRQIPGTRDMEWVIVINTNDRHLTDLVLYDHLPEWMENPHEFTINGNGVTLTPTPGFHKGNPYSFSLVIPQEPGGGYHHEYVITYRTTIKDIYFDNPKLLRVGNNKAWLDFNWHRPGPGPGTWDFPPPTINQPVSHV
ncbi:MAG: hypothetical protein FWD35_03375, partial [Oscillospiraceae bacterium]|nr:hypothetical protein [Oscillospiraceae bacterium]